MGADRLRILTAAMVIVAVATLTAAAPPQPSARLDAILAAAGRYLATYERELAAIVAEETYLQDIRFENRARSLRSDFLALNDPQFGWIGFRDVFEVDGRPVRDRGERLVKLFLKPSREPYAQAMRIVREGTRYNISPRRVEFQRTVNMPLMPLYFLRWQNQARSAFVVDATRDAGDEGTVLVGFTEHHHPRVIETPDRAAATGGFWIEPESGRVAAAFVKIQSRSTTATIHVTFAEQPALAMWLPASMDEEYELGNLGTIHGRAEYSNFRRFRVETTTEIDP